MGTDAAATTTRARLEQIQADLTRLILRVQDERDRQQTATLMAGNDHHDPDSRGMRLHSLAKVLEAAASEVQDLLVDAEG